jgi:hypothetical protein
LANLGITKAVRRKTKNKETVITMVGYVKEAFILEPVVSIKLAYSKYFSQWAAMVDSFNCFNKTGSASEWLINAPPVNNNSTGCHNPMQGAALLGPQGHSALWIQICFAV